MKCRACLSNDLVEMINLGAQPIAHRFLLKPDDKEEKYPFVVYFCRDCGLMQICSPIDPKKLYLDYNYCFSSWKPEPHTDSEVNVIFSHIQPKSVFEVACNDGKFLELLRRRKIPLIAGLDPNPFAGQRAREKGFAVYSEMINEVSCEKIIKEYGRFGLVVARQVLEHVVDIKNFFKCVNLLLNDDGFLFIDIPNFEIALSMGDCSRLWEEHPSYFTESVITNVLLRFGFGPVSVNRYNFSGGVLAILAKRVSVNVEKASIEGLEEKALVFNEKVNRYKRRLRAILNECRQRGYKVVLYGVGCSSSTVINALNLEELIDFAVDDQVERQNKYMPGSKLPIYSIEAVKRDVKPVVFLLAVNQENECFVKQKLENSLNVKMGFISLFSPSDIWMEIERFEKDFVNSVTP